VYCAIACQRLSVGLIVTQKCHPVLHLDELTTVRKNLETQAIEVDNEFVCVSHILQVVCLCMCSCALLYSVHYTHFIDMTTVV